MIYPLRLVDRLLLPLIAVELLLFAAASLIGFDSATKLLWKIAHPRGRG